jgi:acyl carrier protein
MSDKIKNNLIKKIAKKLKTSEKNLIKKDNFQNFDNWDSLIHLEILSLIEQSYGNKINKIKNLAQMTSLKKIFSKLK